MQRINRRMTMPLAEIEQRSAKRIDVTGIGQLGAHFARRETGKLRKKAVPAFADSARQFAPMIGEEQERARRGEFLALEEHRNSRHQQEIGSHRTKATGARQRVTALASSGIGDLVVVLQKDDKAFRWQIERGRPTGFLLPLITLPLIEEAMLGGRDE